MPKNFDFKKAIWIVGGISATWLILYGLGSTLWPLVISSLLAYFLFPVVLRLEQRKIKRDWAILGVFGFLALLIVLIGALVLPGLMQDTKEFFIQLPASFSGLLERLVVFVNQFGLSVDLTREQIEEFIKYEIQKVGTQLAAAAGNFLSATFANIFSWILAILNLFLIPVFFYYIMAEYEKIGDTIKRVIPDQYHGQLIKALKPVMKVLKSYIRGQGTLALSLAAYYSIALSVIQLNFGFVIGIITGVLCLIPYLGFSTGFVLALAVALANYSGMGGVLAVLVVYGIGQVVESFYLTPKLVGGNLGLSPLITLLVLIIGGNLAGLLGMLLAVPVAACVKIWFDRTHPDHFEAEQA